MDVPTGNITRACALMLTILCCGCDSSSRSAPDSAESEDDNWPENALRVEETDLDTDFSAGWVHADASHDWSGGTAASASAAGASASFSFTGTRVRWIGWRESGAGIARVLLDGEPAGRIDLYANTISVQAPVFTSKELAQGPHTLTIEVTGDANPRSTGARVIVDAFEIVSLVDTPRPAVTRSEETDPAVSFTGVWNVDRGCIACSGGTDNYTSGPDALASFSFTGTRVRWLGWRKPAGGLANVYLDGALAAQVDLFSDVTSPQSPLFTSEVLAHGPHTLLIEAGADSNPEAEGSVVSVDAFDVAGNIP
jgi:hypothetical protein